MAKRDYYEILGVSRSASADEIRAAHRKLARKYHPDVNKSPDAGRRFAEVQEAYDVLSDEKKRKLYDQFGHAGAAADPGPGHAWGGASARPGGVHVDVEDLGSMFDAFFGGPRAGGGFRTAGPHRPRPRPRPAQAVEVELPITFMTAARGGVERIRLNIGGRDTSLEVRIPPAVEEGTRLRVRGVDGRDVHLRVAVGRHPLYRRGDGTGKGLDLALDLPLTIAEATLGAKVTVPTLDGPVELAVPPGSPGGRQLRIRGKGLTDQNGRKGDLYAHVRVVTPDPATLDQADREALERIAQRGPEPRAGDPWRTGAGAADTR
jgi:DnaJ-class molecular chaperone